MSEFKICKKCIQPNTRPGIYFDDEDVLVNRNSFVFYDSFYKAMKNLSKDEKIESEGMIEANEEKREEESESKERGNTGINKEGLIEVEDQTGETEEGKEKEEENARRRFGCVFYDASCSSANADDALVARKRLDVRNNVDDLGAVNSDTSVSFLRL